MEKAKVTADTILDYMKEKVENKEVVDAHTWIEVAWKLNSLQGDESDKLFTREQKVLQEKAKLIEEGYPVSKADVIVRSSDEYRRFKIQEAKVEQIREFIRISKIQSKLKDNEYRGA